MDATIITSQDYINDEIVAEKIAARDFAVLVSPIFELSGETFRVILDGHHSFAAAIAAGAEVEFIEATVQDHDAIQILRNGDIEDFLETVHMGSDYVDATTGAPAW